MKQQKPYYLFLTLLGVAMLCLNLLDAPTLSDDMIYRFMWQADDSAPVEPIRSLGDLFRSQWTWRRPSSFLSPLWCCRC